MLWQRGRAEQEEHAATKSSNNNQAHVACTYRMAIHGLHAWSSD